MAPWVMCMQFFNLTLKVTLSLLVVLYTRPDFYHVVRIKNQVFRIITVTTAAFLIQLAKYINLFTHLKELLFPATSFDETPVIWVALVNGIHLQTQRTFLDGLETFLIFVCGRWLLESRFQFALQKYSFRKLKMIGHTG